MALVYVQRGARMNSWGVEGISLLSYEVAAGVLARCSHVMVSTIETSHMTHVR